jgi:hypothetical protein
MFFSPLRKKEKRKINGESNASYEINFDPTDATDNDYIKNKKINLNLSETFETFETIMTSRSKKKQQQIVRGKDGVQWLVDDNGNKIKMVRKKAHRRASIGHSVDPSDFLQESCNSSSEFGSIPPESLRTVATEMSSSHRSNRSRRSQSSDRNRTPRPSKSPKPSTLPKNKSDCQWWKIDDDGNDVNKVQKKPSSSKGDLSSVTDHSRTKNKSKQRKLVKGSKSVRHLSHKNTRYEDGTVDTTGTESLYRPRPKSQRRMSQPNLFSDDVESSSRGSPPNSHGGDLDILMSQSVHEHVRKVPAAAEKPKLRKNKTALGKIGKMIGKSTKALINTSNSKDKDGSLHSLPENLKTKKPLPKHIKEIYGVLWRVDEHGNKLSKVRRKAGLLDALSHDKASNSLSREDSWSSGEEDETTKSYSSVASFEECKNVSFRKRRNQKQRRNTMDNNPDNGKTQERRNSSSRAFRPEFGHANENSGKSLRQHSDESLYVDESQQNLYLVEPLSGDSSHRHNASPSNQQQHQGRGENHNIVQNLQHRLRNSEKEIVRLCRVTTGQHDKMENTKSEMTIMRDKLKTANRDKQALTMEVDNLRMELDRKNETIRERTYEPSSHARNSNDVGSDRLVAEISDLKEAKASLESTMNEQKDRAQARLEDKEGEVRFLQEELARMRSEQGDRHLEYNLKRSASDDDDSLLSGRGKHSSSRNSNSERSERGRSMQFVGNILGNHLREKAETEKALQQIEIKDLQDRVCNLLTSNEKLKTELKRATLEIKDDDDEDVRRAKEAAAECHKHKPNTGTALKDKVMSMSRMHRSSDALFP